MQPRPEIQGVSLVLRGDFTPAMFHPSWFAVQGLIGKEEAEVADVKIVHPDVTAFEMEWLRMRITRDRFQAATAQEPYYEVLRSGCWYLYFA